MRIRARARHRLVCLEPLFEIVGPESIVACLVGSVFFVAAVLIGVGRVSIGAHYPADVLAGALVGLAVALVIVKFGRHALLSLVRIAERVTDPLLAPFWRLRVH